MQLNSIYFAGYAGGPAKFNSTNNGNQTASFSLCHTEKTKEGKEYQTWLYVSCFGDFMLKKCAEIKKGDNVFVQGSIRTNKYTDKDGAEKTSTFIMARAIMIEPKVDKPVFDKPPQFPNFNTDEEIPF